MFTLVYAGGSARFSVIMGSHGLFAGRRCGRGESNYSWYAGWSDLQPFVDEFLSANAQPRNSTRVLVPGVGNDATIVDMHDYGYSRITAMDYAPEGIERCREMLGGERLREPQSDVDGVGVRLVVADARDLKGVFGEGSFDAVFEKGTLDAIFLSGGSDKELACKNMEMAISEMTNCVRPGGVWISVAAVVVDQIEASFKGRNDWEYIVEKDCLYMTEDGFTSNNIDGTLMVWKRREQ